MKIALVSFILLGCAMSLSALSFGGLQSADWTSEDIEQGYKIVGDIAYQAPGLTDLMASLIICPEHLSLINEYFKICRLEHGAHQIYGPVVEFPLLFLPRLVIRLYCIFHFLIREFCSFLTIRPHCPFHDPRNNAAAFFQSRQLCPICCQNLYRP